MSRDPTLFVTGSTGKLGRLVVEALIGRVPADSVVAGVRDLADAGAKAIRAKGAQIRVADYARPDTLASAFVGVDRLLLISSNALGDRVEQHGRVIAAARQAGVGLIAYTSVLHADTSPLSIAGEHRATEAALAASGVPSVVLRNNWYTENYADLIALALQRGFFAGAAGDGRIASASRADYAEAAAAVLVEGDRAGRVHELAGDDAYTLSDFAAAVSRASGRDIPYRNLDAGEHRAALIEAGVPEGVAGVLADADAAAGKGALFEAGRGLSRLIGRRTTPMADVVAAAV